MNKHSYRVIYNEKRGQYIAVQETASGRCKSDNKHKSARSNTPRSTLSLLLSQISFGLIAGFGLLQGVSAQIVGDPSAGHAPQVITPPNSNNVPVVNINAPSAAGVSHNQYNQFDVQNQGVILNNSVTNANTQLGGWIQGNPNLGGGSARIILNEVTSGNPSMLHGYVEVGGQRAEVIIANPAGITVDGGGFINASGVTLTTGVPQFGSYGNLESYRVSRGVVTIAGKGLDTQGADYTQIIARAAEINSGIWANDLRVTAGTGDVAPDASPISLTVEDENGKPLYAIDVAELGGMYAGKIRLIGTEQGVGVHNAGQIGASVGEVSITADGQLINANTGKIVASGNQADVRVATTGNISNLGTIASQGNLQLRTQQQLTNSGVVDGGKALIQAQTANNEGTGRIYGDHLAIEAQTVNNRRDANAQGQAQSAVIAARDRLDIGAQTLNNEQDAMIYSGGAMVVGSSLDAKRLAQGRADLINNNGGKIESSGDMLLQAQQINNTNANYVQGETVKPYPDAQGAGVRINGVAYKLSEVKLRRFDGATYDIPSTGWLWATLEAGDPQNYCLLAPTGACVQAFSVDNVSNAQLHTPVTISSAPGEIIAGGKMVLDGGLLNDKSRIQAGGDLVQSGTGVFNDAKGDQYISRSGTWVFWRLKNEHISVSSFGNLNDTINRTSVSLIVATPEAHATVSGNGLSIPNNSLYVVKPGVSNGYLIETDPRFTNYRNWLTSDYMLTSMGLDPAAVQKRLGDGFYEQQLIRQQVGELTGHRYLAGYGSDDEQYRALMNSGVEFAKKYGLTVGVELTAEQMQHLTSDIVWLVSQDVKLADGSVESVLVPKLYTRSGSNLVTPAGSLMSGNNVYVASLNHAPVNLTNNATIAARENLYMDVNNLQNNIGNLQGNNVYIHSDKDINNVGGMIAGDNSVALSANNNVNISSAMSHSGGLGTSRTELGNVGGVYVSGNNAQPGGGQLVIQAGKDVNLNAAYIGNNAQGGSTTLAAHGDINLGTVTTRVSETRVSSSKNWSVTQASNEIGSTIKTAGDMALVAGGALNARASTLRSDHGAVNASADTINIEAGQNTHAFTQSVHHSSRGTLSRSSRHSVTANSDNMVASSNVSAEQINLNSRGNMNITGSNVIATHDVNLTSREGNINVADGRGERNRFYYERNTSNGVVGRTPASVTVGRTQSTVTDDSNLNYAVGSRVGSQSGNVNISAQNGSYNQVGSDVLAAKGNINVVAQDISVTEARNRMRQVQTSAFKQSGVTLGVNASPMNAMQNAMAMEAAKANTEDSRMQDMADAATKMGYANAILNPTVSVSLGYGTTKTETTTVTTADMGRGSNIQASGNVNLVATGNSRSQPGQVPVGGNIMVQGSNIIAGNNTTLAANDKVNLLAGSNKASQQTTTKSSSSNVGVSVGVGPGGYTAGVSAGMASSVGGGGGGSQTWDYTHVSSGNQTTLVSGGDTNLIGAQVAGNTVKADVGGNMNIRSLQNTNTATVGGGGVQLGVSGGTSGAQASVGVNMIMVNGERHSVDEYAGVMAGNGGFDVNVGGNTDLKGALIASTQNAVDKGSNQLTTGSLSASDIHNSSEYVASGLASQVAISANGAIPGGVTASTSGRATTVTPSGISGGQITINNEPQQQQTTGQSASQAIDAIKRDVLTGQNPNSVQQNWDPKKLQAEIEAQLKIQGAYSGEAMKLLAPLLSSLKGAESGS